MPVLQRWSVALLAAATLGVGTSAAVSAQQAGPTVSDHVSAQQAGPTVSDHVIASFDGTPLAASLFLPPGVSAGSPAPLVLRTHGWGGSRERGQRAAGFDRNFLDPGAGTLARLLAEGYAVLTWDQRGFGCSGGEIRINDPDVEGRDVTALIDWAMDHAPVATDAAGDPIVGMSGGSYAGGIQAAASAVDQRIDALAPEISWSDLRYALYSGSVLNQGWVALFYGYGMGSGTLEGLDPSCPSGPRADALDPAVHQGVSEFLTTGRLSEDTQAFLGKSSLAVYGGARPVTTPTLVLQGSVDTIFDLADGYGIFTHVRRQGVDARFVVFCGGHLPCPASYADAHDRAYLDDAIAAWFARHLRGEDVDTGAPVSYRTNEGVWRDADTFPAAGSLRLSGAARGLPVVPVLDLPDAGQVASLLTAGVPPGIPALPFTSSKAASPGDPRAATFPVGRASGGPLEVRGIPRVELTVSGVAVPLEQAMTPLGPLAETLPRRQVGDVLVGSLGPLGTLSGGLVTGLGGAGASLGGADGSVHVFVKFVHREAGEVLNLQEGAVRVKLSAGGTRVDVPMPGLAYTLPEGDQLDLEVSTVSLMHATGRTPALVDVAVAGNVPVAGHAEAVAKPEDDGAVPGAAPVAPLPGVAAPLPASGGGPAGLALVALLTAGACHAIANGPRPGG